MSAKKKGLEWVGESLQTIGPLIVVVGAIAHEINNLLSASGWLVACGGLVGSLGVLLQTNRSEAKSDRRIRRLERMALLGLLMYLVAGGMMIQGSSSWLALFAIGTLFYIYAVFVKERAMNKQKKKDEQRKE